MTYSYAVRINQLTLTGITKTKKEAVKEAKERLKANFTSIGQMGLWMVEPTNADLVLEEGFAVFTKNKKVVWGRNA